MTFGETITLEELERDPYPIYARLRDEEPVSWVPAVQLWLVTRYDDVRTVCLDARGVHGRDRPLDPEPHDGREHARLRGAGPARGSAASSSRRSAPATSRSGPRA